jgi:RHS repeat-associated protein
MQASGRRLTRNRTLGRGPLRGAWPVLISLAAAACSREQDRAQIADTPPALGTARQRLVNATGEITGSRILRASRDAYVLETDPNHNFGAEQTLRVSADERSRALVGVDAASISQALEGQLARARLELPIANVSEDWPSDQVIAAHRLRHGWNEASVTWSCSTDANPQNASPDCTGDSAWLMTGALSQIPWVEPETSSAIASAGQVGTLEFDVTRDVACGLAGLAPMEGWLIKKAAETGSGRLDLGALDGFDGPALLLEWVDQNGVSVDATDCSTQNPPDLCVPSATFDNTCDGVDDDCDGSIDEDFASVASSCGIGACAATGATSCVDGHVIDSCQATAAATTDATCDGVDDDCDGSIDEDFAPAASSCGVGACAATGASSCVDGHVLDSCQAGTPALADATCDGIDDDCDGSIDEDFAPAATSCGVGACAAAGATSCVDGHIFDSCQASAPAAADATCDGIDDDCDGVPDDDYVLLTTSCGIGACAAAGATSCVDGHIFDSCQAGTPAPADTTCDGIDDDCDGANDDDYAPLSTHCGVGACAAAGSTSCVAGQVADSCSPGTPALSDATCDGVDDDCDGANDDDYVVLTTSCGIGACAAAGATSCVAGQILDSCQAGAPAANDATCDGVDDDCDGVADEDYVLVCSGASVLDCVAGALQPSACSDGNACNGPEGCTDAHCVPGTPPLVDDSNPCTADSCEPATGVHHEPLAAGTVCDDFFACDGASHCVSLLPPDPASVAPQAPAGYVSLFERMRFLFEGSDPIQTGVAPGAISQRSAAVLRGRVLTRAEAPLRGVSVRVHGHPEFGQTLSRLDGNFDLVVNGGGPLTLEYARDGFVQAQRGLRAQPQDFTFAGDVVLLRQDEAVTELSFPSVVAQTHVASASSDGDGARSAVLHVNSGTLASWRMPDGSAQAVSDLSIRATEFSVGATGKSALPADLPATSAYTYAVELSADEQGEAGALGVNFSQPVTVLVDNFLHFATGRTLPLGSYDRASASWSGELNGRVVLVLGVQSGMASLDIDGSGTPATPAQLDALGISSEELQTIAQRYPVGASLWRASLSHLGALALNQPLNMGLGTGGVEGDIPRAEAPLDRPKLARGSIIELDNQLLGERLPLVGTPFSLDYRSDRVPALAAQHSIDIPVTGTSVSNTLAGETVEVLIAGQRHVFQFPPQPNQALTFTWDGLDGEHRPVQGRQPAYVRIGYQYPARYARPSASDRAFGLSGISSAGDPSARLPGQVTVDQNYQLELGANDQFDAGLGAWSISVHHRYDPVGRVLYKGDGTRRSANSIADTIERFAGVAHGSLAADSGDGGLALNATLNDPTAVAVGPDGAVYIGTRAAVRRVDPNTQIITTIAGGKLEGACDPNLLDGTAANMCLNVHKLDFGPDGALYISDKPITSNSVDRIRRLDLQTKQIRHIAGRTPGSGCVNRGDGGLARDAALCNLISHAVGPDGSIYVLDRGTSISDGSVRKISPNGFIERIAGGSWAANVDPGDIAVGPDGSVYVTGDRSIRRILPTGEERVFAGTGVSGNTGDGGLATAATFGGGGPWSVTALPDGRVMVGDNGNLVLRLIDQKGIMHRFAGSGDVVRGDGGTPLSAGLGAGNLRPAPGPDGSVFITSRNNQTIRRIRPTLGGNFAADLLVPSEDGREVYRFDANGRHLETLHALTGGLLYSFGYDAEGRLTQIVDGDGNETSIERDAEGRPAHIVAPFGQDTALETDTNGYLSRITAPSGAQTQLGYDELGQLHSEVDPRGGQHAFSYDASGRLTLDENAGDGSLRLTRSGKAPLTTVTRQTAEGLQASYTTQLLSADIERRTTVREDGRSQRLDTRRDQLQTLTQFDGTVLTSTPGPDPVWGMARPVLSSLSERLPSGSTRTSTEARTAVLATPAQPLSLRSSTQSITVNAKTATLSFDATAHSLTLRSPRGRQQIALIDTQGRITQLSATGLATSSFSYDGGRFVSFTQGSHSLSYGYDVDGALGDVTDALGNTESFLRDADGRVVERQRADGSIIGFVYDEAGNLLSVTPPARPAHELTYTLTNRLESYAAPDTGAGPDVTSYAYDNDDRLTQIARPDGGSVLFAYDSAGRLSTLTAPSGSIALGYFTATGQLQTVNGPTGVNLTFTRDGSLLTGTQWSGLVSGSVTQVFDTYRRVTSESVNGANAISFGYDDDGLVTSCGSLTLAYDPNLPLPTTSTLGQISDTRGYDSYGQLSSYSARFAGSEFFAQSLIRDALDRVQQRTETLAGVSSTTVYGYDELGRLESVSVNGVLTREYSYDANGNRTSVSSGGQTTNASYDSQDRLISYGDFEYTYTRAGALHTRTNLVTGDITNYQYDAFGNLLSVALPDGRLVEYVVDGLGRRVGKKVNGVFVQKWLYRDGQHPIAELNAAGSVVQRFVYGSRADVPEYILRGGATYRVLVDDVGSVRRIVNVANSADVLTAASYDEFGSATGTGLEAAPFGFAGAFYDVDTGLAHSGPRDYDALTGRWLQSDPQRWRAEQTNLYAYRNNDPVNAQPPQRNPLERAQLALSLAQWRAKPEAIEQRLALGSPQLALELEQLWSAAPRR